MGQCCLHTGSTAGSGTAGITVDRDQSNLHPQGQPPNQVGNKDHAAGEDWYERDFSLIPGGFLAEVPANLIGYLIQPPGDLGAINQDTVDVGLHRACLHGYFLGRRKKSVMKIDPGSN